jgi:hypothetical protein
MLAFRSVMSALLSLVVRSFSTNSRPALRAAACGGRPRAGSDTTVTTGESQSQVTGSPPLRPGTAKQHWTGFKPLSKRSPS